MQRRINMLKGKDSIEPSNLLLLNFRTIDTKDVIDIVGKCNYISDDYIIDKIKENELSIEIGLISTDNPVGIIVELDHGMIECSDKWDLLTSISYRLSDVYCDKLRDYLFSIYYKGWCSHLNNESISEHIEDGIYYFSNMIFGKTSIKELNKSFKEFIYNLRK